MKPLAFLTVRLIVNSIRRAVQSPTRILGVLMMTAYWFMIVMRPFGGSGRQNPFTPGGGKLSLPSEYNLHAAAFGLFLIIFFFRALTLFSVPGIYRPADADVLFPSPVKPSSVLLHRFAVDYLVSLIFPLLMLVFAGQRGFQAMQYVFAKLPNQSSASYTGKATLAAFILVSLFSVAMSYAVGMYINRDTPTAREVRKWVGALVFTLVIALCGAVAVAMRTEDPLRSVVSLTWNPAVRFGLYPVTAAADLAISPLYGEPLQAMAAAAFLVAGSAVLFWLTLRQADHLYDMASRQIANTQAAREARQKGDQTLVIIRAAREGKLKPRTLPFLSRLMARRKWALLWKEAILALRTNLALLLLVTLLTVGVSVTLGMSDKKGFLIANLFVQFFMIITVSLIFGQSGFLETLRRVDTQKPLPFGAITVCVMEAFGKSLLPVLVALCASFALLILRIDAWQIALTAAIGLPTTALVVICVQFVIMLLFPDVEDPTQTAFRGVMQFLGATIAVLPGLLAGIGLSVLLPLPLAAAVAMVLNLLVSGLLLYFAAPLYAAYNPTE